MTTEQDARDAGCMHGLEIVGVNDRAGEILLRCTGRHCYQRSRVPGYALDVARVTTESLRVWRPYLRGTPAAVDDVSR